ncbi:MAG: GntR family transcriptional regulator [Anaerolineales bacterium]
MQAETRLLPRYYQLKEILEERIEAGEFPVGSKFPTDDELCTEYRLSRGTVRRALNMLVDDGRLRREQGRGTFVCSPHTQPVFFRLGNFNEEMKMRGWQPSTKLLKLRELPASEEVANHLQIPAGERTIEIVRLRLADEKPIALETRYLAYTTCPTLLEEDLESQSIHSLLLDKYKIPLIRACYTIEARVLSKKEAAYLQVDAGSAAFAVERVTYTTSERPVTWYRTVYRGDVYRFSAEF